MSETVNIKEFVWKLIELFPQAAKAFHRHEHNYLSRGEITLPQFWALDHLYRNGKCKMNDLAKILMVSPPAATGLIDRLIGQKLVARENDERDRRIIWIILTAKGRTVIRSIRSQKIQTLTRVFSRISAADREHYLDILEKIVKTSDTEPAEKNGK